MNGALFGKFGKDEIYTYSLKNNDAQVDIITLGARIQKFVAFGTDIVAGYDTLSDYISENNYHGALVGRVANRIKGASFSLDGVTYALTKNNRGNTLHGGNGLHNKPFYLSAKTENSLTLTYISSDMDDGFPGNLEINVTYTLIDTALMISYHAKSNKKTPISLTNHSYFNLDGFENDVTEHSMKIYAERYTAVDKDLIPTGERPLVEGTLYDFREWKKIGDRFSESLAEYDRNYILSSPLTEDKLSKRLRKCAQVKGKHLGMRVYTDRDGVQLYTPKKAPVTVFKYGIIFPDYYAFCLETQDEPNSLQHGIGIYAPDETYTHTVIYEIERL